MYAAGRCGPTNTIYLDIGYYLNLATFEEVSKRNNASLLHEQSTVFKKDGNSLNILLEKFEPMNWTYSKGKNPQAPEPASVHQPSTSKRQEAARAGTSTAGIEAPDLVVTTATIQDLSHKFCDEWRIVGSKLGIGEPKLQTIDTDNRTAQEKVYQMLLTWKQSKGNEATYRLLGEALQSAGRKDLQEYLYQQANKVYPRCVAFRNRILRMSLSYI
ncbi:hypothetical protein BSL78_03896 [Apostichopus japonicus]|uniref:Death domain-containing protein n=1 Tax=Stichopus japonicus TaxID=307972 RepID=A0A2G8LG21_STIJA|nr:hypothetical protein BSL78_03896 [Apostichopus japonicus]